MAAVWAPPADRMEAELRLCLQVVAGLVEADRVEARGTAADDDFYLADWAAPGRSAWQRSSTWLRSGGAS